MCNSFLRHELYVVNGLAGWSETWKDHDWKIVEKVIWGIRMWLDLCKRTQACKDTCVVSYVNGHKRRTSAEEVFYNQVDRMTHSVDNPYLSPVIPVIAQWVHN